MIRHGKRMMIYICAILFCLLFATSEAKVVAAATQTDGSIQLENSVLELFDKLDLAELEAYINSLEDIEPVDIKQRVLAYIKGDGFSYESFFQSFFGIFSAQAKELAPIFSLVAAIALLSGVLSMLQSGSMSSTVSEMIFLISYAAALIPLISILSQCFEEVSVGISHMQKQMQITYPLLLTLMAVNGGTATAAICRPTVAFFAGSIVSIVRTIVLPVTLVLVVLSLSSHLSKNLKISKFGGFFKSVNKWTIGICVSVFGIFFTLQGITAATYDGLARRAAKYAIGTGVPIIGGFLSGGFDLAIAGGILIKNALGNMSIFLLISVLVKPVVLLITVNLFLRLTAAVTQPFGESRISDFLTETVDNLQFFTASLLFTAFMYFLTIIIMINVSEALF